MLRDFLHGRAGRADDGSNDGAERLCLGLPGGAEVEKASKAACSSFSARVFVGQPRWSCYEAKEMIAFVWVGERREKVTARVEQVNCFFFHEKPLNAEGSAKLSLIPMPRFARRLFLFAVVWTIALPLSGLMLFFLLTSWLPSEEVFSGPFWSLAAWSSLWQLIKVSLAFSLPTGLILGAALFAMNQKKLEPVSSCLWLSSALGLFSAVYLSALFTQSRPDAGGTAFWSFSTVPLLMISTCLSYHWSMRLEQKSPSSS